MHYFEHKRGELYCEDVPVRKIAASVGTPLYLYSHATLERHFKGFSEAFGESEHLVCYSAKANASRAILNLFSRLGGGLDIVSGGELYRGLKAGVDPKKVVYSGVGKRVDEIDDALNAGILMFNVESLEELNLIDQRAGAMGKKAPVGIRVNPDVDPKTHPYISTGLKKNKFGIGAQEALDAYRAAYRLTNVEVIGIDCHIGSQITDPSPFEDAMKNIASLVASLKEIGMGIRFVDVGGGLGITYRDESPPGLKDYAKAITGAFKGMDVSLILEPGRVLVGNAGILVTRVLYRKPGPDKSFIIVDAGMNDLLRPSLYDAYHEVVPVESERSGAPIHADVVGPICETGDFLARDRSVADVPSGGLLAVMSAGAYGFAMSSNYCSRLRIAEVMVRGDAYAITRQRETYAHLTTGESLPNFSS